MSRNVASKSQGAKILSAKRGVGRQSITARALSDCCIQENDSSFDPSTWLLYAVFAVLIVEFVKSKLDDHSSTPPAKFIVGVLPHLAIIAVVAVLLWGGYPKLRASDTGTNNPEELLLPSGAATGKCWYLNSPDGQVTIGLASATVVKRIVIEGYSKNSIGQGTLGKEPTQSHPLSAHTSCFQVDCRSQA